MKFVDKKIGLSQHPIMIVGQNPGRAKNGKDTGIAWDGENRSAQYLMAIIGDSSGYGHSVYNMYEQPIRNLILTNVCPYQDMDHIKIEEGVKELKEKIEIYKPRKIVCLGLFAYEHVMSLRPDCPVAVFHHPSFVIRFNKDKYAYADKLRKALRV